ncbi:MAG TPA: DUF488 domain-containing protein [Armatimonadota bacterium]|jgi:uncharacterized protein YeaO (DUF488 family)
MIRLKRAYETPSDDDGRRILVERLWPRGITKERVHLDLWMKDIAPSAELRKWFGHDPSKWNEFKRRYWEELRQNETLVQQLEQITSKEDVTFVFAAKDTEHDAAVALKEFIDKDVRSA